MAFLFECVAVTHIGNSRVKNEDNFLASGEMLLPEEQAIMSQAENKQISKRVAADSICNRIFAVSDGMGGHKFGSLVYC